MSSRRDIMVPRKKKDGGTYWVKIGTAWLNDKGSEQLVFDCLPLPDSEGRCVANLFEPKARDGERTQTKRQSAQDDWGSGGWEAAENDGF